MCKPFPPPLVRGGVFEVGLETKYRDIADGNPEGLAVRTVVVVVGNQVPRYSGLKRCEKSRGRATSVASEPKYRDIADGEHPCFLLLAASCFI